MNQDQRRRYLLDALLAERPDGADIPLPAEVPAQRQLLRALCNLRPPAPVSAEFLRVQDAYLQEVTAQKGVTRLQDLAPVEPGLYLWKGDITTLGCDAIVNAANSALLGCFYPCHGCIDNAIHTFAGLQLRAACAERMQRQGHPEPAGGAKITPAFNLPCRYVLHTVGPIVDGHPTEQDAALLESCYRSCLALAEQHGLHSVAFCCISTGEFHFPNRQAAAIAIKTVRQYRAQAPSAIEVIFNVFKQNDYDIYRQLLGVGR